MDFSKVEYPEELMAGVEKDADEAVERRSEQLTSIFPRVEALITYGEYREAFLFFVDKDALREYEVTMTDFLLCELFPEFEKQYQLFMAGASDQVKESITEEQRRKYEHAMLVLLGNVMLLYRERPDDEVPKIRWNTIVDLTRQVAAKAPKRAVTSQ